MAYLINRNSPARAHCLHALCQFACAKYPSNDLTFRMADLKYNQQEVNIHTFCSILKTDNDLGIAYCRYKDNPLSLSGCGLTNGSEEDSTKSKEVSNTVNAMHSLGFFERNGNDISITDLGRDFARAKTNSKQFFRIFRKAALNSGLMIGLLGQLYLLNKSTFTTDELYIGYPNAGQEKIIVEGESIIISSGSENDSNTRTKSCLLAWGVTAGFFAPSKYATSTPEEKTSYILSKIRSLREYVILDFPNEIFENNFITNKPLDYKNLTKNTKALRENNQEKIRNITLSFEHKIQNRRLAILYLLNRCYESATTLNLKHLISFLRSYQELFVIDLNSFDDIMYEEINIGFVAGIPFEITSTEEIKPLSGINKNELIANAPKAVVDVLNRFPS